MDESQHWLKINLEIKQQGEQVWFHIFFCNQSVDTQVLKFSDRNYKAALLGLRFFDENGDQLQAKRTSYLLAPVSSDEHIIPPDDQYEYVIYGTSQGGKLTFEICFYPTVRGQKYFVSFGYLHSESERVPIVIR
ncbi:hypothetical protein ACTHGU_21595 [Chitinophagaceae bacterium MMS25-I14]